MDGKCHVGCSETAETCDEGCERCEAGVVVGCCAVEKGCVLFELVRFFTLWTRHLYRSAINPEER